MYNKELVSSPIIVGVRNLCFHYESSQQQHNGDNSVYLLFVTAALSGPTAASLELLQTEFNTQGLFSNVDKCRHTALIHDTLAKRQCLVY